MNPFRAFSRRQASEINKPLRNFVHSSSELCGAVFVLVEGGDDVLNASLPLAQKIAAAHNARFVGMMSGLLQFVIKGAAEADIEPSAKALSEEIVRLAGMHTLVVWTVQRCAIGCWGDDTTLSYGALVPNFRELLAVLSSRKHGEIIRI